MSTLLELYEGLVNLSGLIADKDGYISVIHYLRTTTFFKISFDILHLVS